MTEELKPVNQIVSITINREESSSTYVLGEHVHVIVVCSKDRPHAEGEEIHKADADAVVSGHIEALGCLLDQLLARNPAVLASALRAKVERIAAERPWVVLAGNGITH